MDLNDRVKNLIISGKEYYDDDISDIDDYAAFYNLSSLRNSLMSFYPVPYGRVMEVGCGCGAMTGALCDTAEYVDAVDKDPLAVSLTEKRYAGRRGLKVICADIDGFESEKKYDLITVIEFIESYKGDIGKLLERLGNMLLPGGKILLGFRNRYGIRYRCGAIDEYVKEPGSALSGSVPLHDKEEMIKLAEAAGLTAYMVYYPVPDLVFTQAVWSDASLPEGSIRDRVLTYDPFGEGSAYFAKKEYNSYDEIIRSGRFPECANTVLLELRRDKYKSGKYKSDKDSFGKEDAPPDIPVKALLSADRERDHAFATLFYGNGTVVKKALFEEGSPTLIELSENMNELSGRGIAVVPHLLKEDGNKKTAVQMPFIKYGTFTDHIRGIIRKNVNVKERILGAFEALYKDILRSSEYSDECAPELLTADPGPVLKKAYTDMTGDNAFVEPSSSEKTETEGERGIGNIIYTDQEFTIKNCPAKYVLYRAIRYMWIHIAEAENAVSLEEMKEHFGLAGVWDKYTLFEDAFTERNRNRRKYAQLYKWAWGSKKYDTGLVIGTFDLFHEGHVNLLRRAKERCRILRAGVMSDALVYKYKKIVPEYNERERLDIISSSEYVDEAFIVEGDYVSKVAEWHRKPYDCFFSGDDYADNEYWKKEKEELNALGADIEFFPYTKGVSSSMLREKLRREKD